MAATVSSPWAKPGAWALDSEEHEAAELEQQQQHQAKIEAQPLADFPSLSAAAAAKPKKKNKPQKVSLAEFSVFGGPKPPAEPVGLTHEDRLVLPTGPRERTAEELEKGRLGGGFKSYGADRNREDSSSKWGSQRREGGGGFGKESDRDAPSRADEVDDWGAGKKSVPEKRERVGFGFGSQSKADESDSWVTNKTSSFSSEGRRPGGGGFDRDRKVGFGSNGGGADSESWGRKREEVNGGGGFERERKVGLGFNSNGGGADSESWGRREESNGGTESNGRPRLKLQPRTLPVTLPPPPPVVSSNESLPVAVEIVPRPKGANPFGAARPREDVLAEKGKDWKKIDKELEAVKLKEKEAVAAEGESFGKRSFGMGNGRPGDRTDGVWRKPAVAEAEAEAEGEVRPQSAGNDESRRSNSEEPEPENENENENVTEN
ncbi:eukaryotic translation initiation factor 4B3 [Argentina anserina]|uniref:eukaryotic translation initiation factor 4B3 n=1 Tax=Argentina anserina TaxID=57926 RepID=UPI0021764875|nr:eukaryotic translation initiation factor 4B3 [Potentilla anserina]